MAVRKTTEASPMHVDMNFLRSRVARRVFGLFVVSALVPIAITTLLAFTQVSDQLIQKSRLQLKDASKSYGLDVYGRLLFLDGKTGEITSRLAAGVAFQGGLERYLTREFLNLARIDSAGKVIARWGEVGLIPDLSAQENRHLASGKGLLRVTRHRNGAARVFLIRSIDTPQALQPDSLVAEVSTPYLWGPTESLPYQVDLCVLGADTQILFCSHTLPPDALDRVASGLADSSAGPVDWQSDDRPYLGSYWTVFMRPQFFFILAGPRFPYSRKNMRWKRWGDSNRSS